MLELLAGYLIQFVILTIMLHAVVYVVLSLTGLGIPPFGEMVWRLAVVAGCISGLHFVFALAMGIPMPLIPSILVTVGVVWLFMVGWFDMEKYQAIGTGVALLVVNLIFYFVILLALVE